ncbi:MAG: class F sortase [Marmoricola sp.]
MDEVSNGRRAALVALVVATAVALVWSFWPHSDEAPAEATVPPAQAVVAGSVFRSAECGTPVTKPFRPTRISIAHVAHNAEILALGRDGNNVPGAPALSSLGKTQFAWDDPSKANPGIHDLLKPPGAMPGATAGNVLMNAHTWPDDSALGNRLLDHLEVGDKIVLNGKGAQLCYKVTKRIVIQASDGSAEYYQQDGPPQIALIVCSPPRLGPGNWKNRTIWFASPTTA